jgi:hypothetical protein
LPTRTTPIFGRTTSFRAAADQEIDAIRAWLNGKDVPAPGRITMSASPATEAARWSTHHGDEPPPAALGQHARSVAQPVLNQLAWPAVVQGTDQIAGRQQGSDKLGLLMERPRSLSICIC